VPVATGVAELVTDREDAELVTLLVNGVPSSCLHLTDPLRLEFEYHQQMAAAVDLLPSGPLTALHVGAGACTLPRWLDAARPGSRQVAVDVDATLLEHVRLWFELPRSPRLRLRTADGLDALAGQADASLDLVVRDAFDGDRTPERLTTAAFLAQVARTLRPGGVYLANIADRAPLALARAEVATALATFAQVALVAEPGVLRGRRYGNLVLVAGPLDPGRLDRRTRVLAVPAHVVSGADLVRFVAGARPIPGPEPHQAPG
jgi:SAM-dependent methyltransferase